VAQQWEHCEVQTVDFTWVAHFYALGGCIHHADTEKTFSSASEFIARLGAAGWELVNVDTGHLYFKRPVKPGRRIDDAF
jgi:hypothetical protein